MCEINLPPLFFEYHFKKPSDAAILFMIVNDPRTNTEGRNSKLVQHYSVVTMNTEYTSIIMYSIMYSLIMNSDAGRVRATRLLLLTDALLSPHHQPRAQNNNHKLDSQQQCLSKRCLIVINSLLTEQT